MSLELLVIAILEGLTEFLPISSTGHLIIASRLLDVNLADPYIKFYLLVIQFGAVLAGLLFFGKRILSDRNLILTLLISFIPSAILGFALYSVFKHLLEGNMVLLSAMLFIGGVIFIYLEKRFMRRHGEQDPEDFGSSEISKKDAFIVGLAQAVAIVPGVSRSGATIVAGILRGVKKSVIIEYTFLLALPTLGAAVAYDAYRSRDMLAGLVSYGELVVGCVVALISAGLTLYVLKKYLLHLSLTAFGWYRIALSLIIIVILY